jgi:hypothetical protein
VSAIVGELARVREAFDKPTLRLLDRKWAPLVPGLTAEQIMQSTSEYFGVSMDALMGQSRSRAAIAVQPDRRADQPHQAVAVKKPRTLCAPIHAFAGFPAQESSISTRPASPLSRWLDVTSDRNVGELGYAFLIVVEEFHGDGLAGWHNVGDEVATADGDRCAVIEP